MDREHLGQRHAIRFAPSRSAHTMVFDNDRARVRIFGGQDFSGNPLGDVWEWNGTTWEAHTPSTAQPVAREFAAAAYDLTRKVMVMVGGGSPVSGGVFSDTWEFSNPTSLVPAALLSFDFSTSGGFGDASISGWTLTGSIGGMGFTTVSHDTGTESDGARLLAWDPTVGDWFTSSNASALVSVSNPPASNNLSVSSGIFPDSLLGGDGTFNFAVAPTSSQGNGPASTPANAGCRTFSWK